MSRLCHRFAYSEQAMCHSPFFCNDTAPTELYTLSLHDALPIWLGFSPAPPDQGPGPRPLRRAARRRTSTAAAGWGRSEEHTSELQSRRDLVCRLLLEKKKPTRLTCGVCTWLSSAPTTGNRRSGL